jgi:hypothetical protein
MRPGPTDDDRAAVFIVPETERGALNLQHEVLPDGVSPLGPVETQRDDATVSLKNHAVHDRLRVRAGQFA